MLEELAWKTFKNTGNIDTMIELLKVDQVQSSILLNDKTNESIKIETQNILNK